MPRVLVSWQREIRTRRNMGTSNYQATFEKSKSIIENSAARNSRFDEDKAAGKQKEKEAATKEVSKSSNPYAKPFPNKYFKCNQPGHRSSDCPLRKGMVEREEEEGEDATYREADGDDDGYDEEDKGATYVIQRLMLAPK